ncbi:unnamed protein product [Phaedon cochleariae]|uniref:GH18 domain-containing protein n=1 Tax=Phaedon cochleariae TaxID=80249 RepID=A0A9N9SB56_PHACE|nr:unnamed protein product [Phaedon cochleariae]
MSRWKVLFLFVLEIATEMFSEDIYRYTVLSHFPSPNNSFRTRWQIDRKMSIILLFLISPLIFCFTYLSMFGMPHFKYGMTVPEQSVHRAILYSSSQNMSHHPWDFHLKTHKHYAVKGYKLVCYYSLPSSSDSLQVEDIDPFLCTHLNVAFATVVNNTAYLDEKQKDYLKKLLELKQSNENLKVLVSVGGAGNIGGFPEMVANHTNRKTFIQSVIHYVKNYGIDGVDLDWEFPNEEPGKDKIQRVHFTQLLEEFRKSINREPHFPYILSVSVAAPAAIIDNSYDVAYINEYVDFINVMSYDYHFYTKVTPFTGINSPLYTADNEKYYLSTLNINYSVNYWNYLGVERHKINVGLPTYGHTFRLINPSNNGTYAPSLGYGKLGKQGFVSYPQICQFLSSNQITPVFDMETKSPYASKYYEWISFDNSQSLIYKAEYIRDNNFGGAMVWSLNSDDYKGICKDEQGGVSKFTLIRNIKKVLQGES